jgi:hypothetical protein
VTRPDIGLQSEEIQACYQISNVAGKKIITEITNPIDDIAIPAHPYFYGKPEYKINLPADIRLMIDRYVFWAKVKACDFVGAFAYTGGSHREYLRIYVLETLGYRSVEMTPKQMLHTIRYTLRLMDRIMDDYLVEDIPEAIPEFRQFYNVLTFHGTDEEYLPWHFGCMDFYINYDRHMSSGLWSHYLDIYTRGPLFGQTLLVGGVTTGSNGFMKCETVYNGYFVLKFKGATPASDGPDWADPQWKAFGRMARFAFGNAFGAFGAEKLVGKYSYIQEL